ncbi:MAG: phosphoenolpyruvate--protein phosphotransferase [Planctomycetales bacterium]|nr:phosphoenolpyruvate--protein phosphotransferase [Planctomycetales bacterium]
MRKGIAVSPGVAIGTAYCIHEVFVHPGREVIQRQDIAAELARFENARKQSLHDVRLLQTKVQRQIGKEAAAIFSTHESILQDPALVGKVRTWISQDLFSAPAALAKLVEYYQGIFHKSRDEYLRERLTDIRDVVERLSSFLSDALQTGSDALTGSVIVVADELLPSQVVMLGSKAVHGIITQAGGQTSHAAIIARSRGIPAVSGVTHILRQAKTGDTVIVDGRDGHVIVNPNAEVLAAYRKLEREFVDLRDHLAHNRDQPAITADHESLDLMANINGIGDAQSAVRMGASGVGLYRTEYLYLAHTSVPSEQEQFEIYRDVVNAAPNHRVTIRTLDIGGDKSVPFLGRTQFEANPFMGWRSIRLSFEHPAFFLQQIRAILRAAGTVELTDEGKCSQVDILFPMVTNLEELRRLRAFMRKAEQQLRMEHKPYGKVGFGMMVEVPAAAIMIDQLLPAVDFVSIGSNDLVQYLMAADRDNPKVSHLCQPLSPAVIRLLESVVRACNSQGKPVTLCGEMAGQPQAFVLLLGMGLRRFSMSPAFVPSIKELASHISLPVAKQVLASAMRQKTNRKIHRMLTEQLLRLAPNLRPIIMQ